MRKTGPLFAFKGVQEPAGSPEPDRFTHFLSTLWFWSCGCVLFLFKILCILFVV